MALFIYSLVVLWYRNLDEQVQTSMLPSFPWYGKEVPAFSDMLAALRQQTWRQNVVDPLSLHPSDQKQFATLLREAAYAA